MGRWRYRERLPTGEAVLAAEAMGADLAYVGIGLHRDARGAGE